MPDWGLSGDGQNYVTWPANAAVATDGVQTLTAAVAGVPSPWVVVVPSSNTMNARGFIYQNLLGGSNGNICVDIGLGAPGSEKTIVQRFYCEKQGTNPTGGHYAYIPLSIPAGVAVSVRHAEQFAFAGGSTHLITLCGSGFRGNQSYGKCTTYNMQGGVLDGNANSGLVQAWSTGVADRLTVAGTYGPWIDITGIAASGGGTLAYPASAVMFVMMPMKALVTPPDSSLVLQRTGMDIGIGPTVNSGVTTLFSGIPIQVHSDQDRPFQSTFGPWPCHIPAGTRVQARINATLGAISNRYMAPIMYAFS